MKQKRNLIRVFLSSTFRDMTREREYLNKIIFPEVRQITRTRGVEFSAIDLRWGVTESEANQGDVLSICLEEIDRCKPFFMGFLGERYGWAPTAGDVRYYEQLIERFPITESSLHNRLSVTEMEILHGVLESEGEIRASFYQRDPALTEIWASTEEASVYFEEEESGQVKLTSLKQRIADSEYPIHAYESVEEMGARVKSDLLALLDELYPESEIPDPIEAERRRHRLYAEDRISFYLPNQQAVQTLHDFVNRQRDHEVAHKPLLVTGPSGRGKSALISYWLTELINHQPQQWVIEHYAGVAHEDNAVSVLTRLIGEMKQKIDPEDNTLIPSDFDDLCEEFSSWLARVSPDQPLLLVIDAINQISASNLRWIPTILPAHVTCVMSALPSDEEKWLKLYDAKLYEVAALDLEARRAVTEGYLARYRKKLSQAQLDRVVTAEPCESPLFLTTILAELVVFGSFEKLNDYIDHLVGSLDLSELFERMITRFEEDYGKKLTREVLTALWASKTGLTDDELVGVSNFPLVEVSKITLALDQHLKESGGLIQFTHSFLETAVRDLYLLEEMAKKASHHKLANWFRQHSSEQRRAMMIGYQNYLARDWSQLHTNLTDAELGTDMIRYLSNSDLFGSWVKINENLGLSMDIEYEQVWQSEEEAWHKAEIEEGIASLITYAGHATDFQYQLYQNNLQRKRFEVQQRGTPESQRDLSLSLVSVGDIAKARGKLDDALNAYQESLEIRRGLAQQLGTPQSQSDLSLSLVSVGDIAKARGELDDALNAYQESLEIRRGLAQQLGTPQSQRDLGVSLNRVGDIAKMRGELDDALNAYQEMLKISRGFAQQLITPQSFRDLSVSLARVGGIAKMRGELDDALNAYQELLKRSRLFAQQLGTPQSQSDLSASLNRVGDIAKARGELDDALNAYQEGLEISRDLAQQLGTPDSQSDLSVSLRRVGDIARARGELDDALNAYQESLEISRDLAQQLGTPDSQSDLSVSLDRVGDIAEMRGELDDALNAYQEMLKISRHLAQQLGTPDSQRNLSVSLCKVGDIGKARGKLDDALNAYQESLEIDRGLAQQLVTPDSQRNLSISLNKVGDIAKARGELDDALNAYQESLEIFRDLAQQLDTPQSLEDILISSRRCLEMMRKHRVDESVQEILDLWSSHFIQLMKIVTEAQADRYALNHIYGITHYAHLQRKVMEKGKLLEELEIIFSSIPMALDELEFSDFLRSPLFELATMYHPSLKTTNIVQLALHKVNKSVPYTPQINTLLYPIVKIMDFIRWLRRAR